MTGGRKILTARGDDGRQMAQRMISQENHDAGEVWSYALAASQFKAVVDNLANNTVAEEAKAKEDDSADREAARKILAAAKSTRTAAPAPTEGEDS